MATLTTIPDGDTNWGGAMRDNLSALNTELIAATANVARKYELPSTGVPKESLAPAVQTSLGKADVSTPTSRSIATGTGLTGGGSLGADRTLSLTTAVQASLGKADTAYQKPSGGIPDTDLASKFVKTINGGAPDSAGNIVVSGGGGGDAFQTTDTANGDLSVSQYTDSVRTRSWLENAPDLGPTEYAAARLAPAVIKALGAEAVRPTGGVNDEVAINAALVRSQAVILTGNYRLSGPIVMPSHRTLIAEDAYVRLEAGANCNLITNSNLAVRGNTGIRVVGIGRAVFDGNAENQTRQTDAGWKNVGIHWVGVSNFLVSGITIRNTNAFSALHVGCTNGYWTNINLDQNRAVVNQDGIDFGPGNSFIYVNGVYGRVEDDCFSIFAKYSSSANTIHPAFSTGGDTHHLYISNVWLDTVRSLFRIQAAEGSSVHHIYGNNVHHTGPNRNQAFVNLGELKPAYVSGSYPDSQGRDFYAIYMNNISGRTGAMVRMSTYVKDCYFSNFASDNWGYVFTSGDGDVGAAFNVNIDGVTTIDNGATSVGVIVELDQANHTADRLSITNMNIARADRVTFSAQPVTNGILSGTLGQVDTRVFGGTSNFTGKVDLTIKTSGYTAGTTPTNSFSSIKN